MRSATFSPLFACAILLLAPSPAPERSATLSPGAPAGQTLPAIPQLAASPPQQAGVPPARAGLSVVVLDPAHGGTDPGARGVGGLRESDLVLALATATKAALERQGFQIVLTRQGNEDRSFDDRAALANAQRGAVFLTLHIGSTGLPGTVHAYTCPDDPSSAPAPGGLLPWDRAQTAFLPLSRKLADLAQGEFARQFKGSPNAAPTAAVRQLRTIAAPAVAIELSSVSVEDRGELDRMLPGVAEAIARAVAAFKPVYDSSPPGAAR